MTQLEAFLLTHALEVPVALVAARLGGVVWWRAVLVALVASTITHPFVWWLNHDPDALPLPLPMTWMPLEPWARLILLEVGAVAVESVVYVLGWGVSAARGVLTSLAANAFSFGVGLLVFRLTSD